MPRRNPARTSSIPQQFPRRLSSQRRSTASILACRRNVRSAPVSGAKADMQEGTGTSSKVPMPRAQLRSGVRITLEPREEQMVLPGAVDAEIFAGKAFAAEPGLLEQPDRGRVGRDAGGLDAMQAQRLEGERDEAADRRRHVALPPMDRADPIAEIAGLRAAAPDIGEREA